MSRLGWKRAFSGWRPAWAIALVAAALSATLLDAVLFEMSSGYFTNGFNIARLATRAEIALFAWVSLSLDLMLVLGLFGLLQLAPLGSASGPLRRFVLVAFLGACVPLLFTAMRYDLENVAGRIFSVALARASEGGGGVSLLLDAADLSLSQALLLPVALLALTVVGLRIRGRLRISDPARFAAPPARSIWIPFGALAGFAMAALVAPGDAMERVRVGLDRKLSAALVSRTLALLSDFDRDGFGSTSRPRDPDPFDARVRPWAIDVPDNGLDEDGLAGDRAVTELAPPARCAAAPARGDGVHLLLVYLESFRADLIDRRIDGREVTPFLNRLGREGASARHAYVHSPWTLPSRASLFSGNLAARAGEPSLVDDFRAGGYRVAHFSGQDDSYGDSISVLGFDRADLLYHARDDVDRRTSRSTTAVSLQVSWKTLLGRVQEYLAAVELDAPLFVYVNVVDTHFPYTHAEIDPLIGASELPRGSIRSTRADEVFRVYANTAANVDRAVEQLVGSFRARIAGAEHAIVVTADHGQSFYEDGLLGHGQALDASQTHVPLILWGIGGDWPEPSAPSDLRGLIRCELGRERGAGVPRARFVPRPDREILQWTPTLAEPHRIALRRLSGVLEYDFIADAAALRAPEPTALGGPALLRAEPQRAVPSAGPDFEHLIQTWEAARAEHAASDTAARSP